LPSAIILLSTASGSEESVLRSLRMHECVQEAHLVQSAYDIVVKVKAETFDKLTAIIRNIKLLMPKPQSIVTMLVVEGKAVG
jgi:DNA-binding Lrp family transcriptional regulator